MAESLALRLKKIKVDPGKLILDPNNPRFITSDERRVDDQDLLDPGVQAQASLKMGGPTGRKATNKRKKVDDPFHISALEDSIRANGWQPVDAIFVRKYGESGHYLVLEGNRRITAIRNLLNSDDLDEELKNELDEIEVMEILGTMSDRERDEKIAYLLGVRHHGSLKPWSPFAQASSMFAKYLQIADIDADQFEWKEEIAKEVASGLSVEVKFLKERIRVFRAMQQIGNSEEVKEGEEHRRGGMKDRYYSVCKDALLSGSNKLRDYISQDPETMLLDGISISRMNNLCHFSEKGRKGAPIVNSPQWRSWDNILKEEDQEKRTRMISEVETQKRRPSEVWSHRAEELRKLQWDKWLRKANTVLSTVNVGGIEVDQESEEVVSALIELVEHLSVRDFTEAENA